MDIANHICTFLAFVLACLLVLLTPFHYLVVNICRTCWLAFLKKWFPDLEFIRNVTVRTATDTIRNQGIITVLLTVKGSYDAALIKESLKENILDRRNKNGKPMFPHLQTPLTHRFGRYAWVKKSHFNIDNHVIVSNSMFRGRLVNDLNIQEYVSDFVTKYFPSDQSPWQMNIIPSYATQRFYLLIRIHHLLLSEDGLGLGDLLLLGPQRANIFKRLLNEDDENPQDITPPRSPLTGLLQPPVAIPKLFNNICGAIMSCWEHFLSVYDPMENPSVLKSKPGIQVCSAIILITGVSIITELIGMMKDSDVSLFHKVKNISFIIFYEVEKRQCTPQFIALGILNSLNPSRLILSSLKWVQFTVYTCFIALPFLVIHELRAIVSRDKSRCYSKLTLKYMLLLISAMKEIWYIWTVIYTAPKMLLDELIISHRDPKHELQVVSLCGRKVVAWSDPVPLDRIHRIGSTIGASPSEILISASAAGLKEYFRNFGFKLPESVLATARYFPLESLMKISRGVEDSLGPPSGRGLLCLTLPMSQSHDNPSDTVHEIQKTLAQIREKQIAIYEASLWQLDGGYITKIFPSLTVRLILNLLSRRYAVALTEVAPELADESSKQLKWGQEVESAMYWRPPQSNICLSLTLMSYGDSVRLGVMVDSMITPGHTAIVSGFLQEINKLAAVSGIPTASTPFHFQPNIPPDGATMSTHGSNTSVSSASEELRRLATSSPDLNISTSSATSRSNSPESSGAQSTHSSNEENIFPFTD